MNTESKQEWLQRVAGQVVVVTGGGGVIGSAICEAFSKHGALVAVADVNMDLAASAVASIEDTGGRAIAVEVDVADRASTERMVQQVERELGPIDLLINNAGLAGAIGPIWEVDPEQWWKVWQVNMLGVMLCSRAVLSGMVARRGGRIINMSSGSILAPIKDFSSYPVSKTAMTRFTEHMALDTSEYGISVFAITPGLVYTPLALEVFDSTDGRKWTNQYADVYAEKHVPAELGAERCLEIAAGRADRLSGCYIQLADDLDDLTARSEEIQSESLYRLRIKGESATPFTPRVAVRSK